MLPNPTPKIHRGKAMCFTRLNQTPPQTPEIWVILVNFGQNGHFWHFWLKMTQIGGVLGFFKVLILNFIITKPHPRFALRESFWVHYGS